MNPLESHGLPDLAQIVGRRLQLATLRRQCGKTRSLGRCRVNMRHPLRGLLIGPMIAPIAYWIGVMAYAWLGDSRLSWFQALRELMMIVAFGLPIAYVAVLVWGAPVLYALYRIGWLRAGPVIVAGALGGTIVAVGFALSQHGDSLIRVHMPLPGGTALGALVAGLTWWAGQGGAKQHAPAT